MYQIDELIDNQWKFVYESEDIHEIDKIAFKLTNLEIPSRIIHNNILLIFLNGTYYQYEYWKTNYVRKPKRLERIFRNE